MTAFSPENLRTIGDFAGRMGLPLRPSRDGSVSFVFAEAGTLTLTAGERGEEVHVSLARRPPRVDARLMRAALAGAGFDPSSGHVVHSGLTADEAVILSVRLAPEQVSLPAIEDCLQLLRQRHDGMS